MSRPLAGALALLVFLAVSASAAPAAKTPVPLLPACSVLDLEYQPTRWSPGCTGGSPLLGDLRWSGWGTATATAQGNVALNDCEPSCAEGTSYTYPAQMTVYRVKRCRKAGRSHLQYTRVALSWLYPEDNPFDQPPGWQPFGLNPLKVRSSDCRRRDEPLHDNRLQAAEIAVAAARLALIRKDWDTTSEGSVTRASKCRRIGKRRFACHVFSRASDSHGFSWWRGVMRIAVGRRRASWRWTGVRRKCTSIFRCGPAPFRWAGKIDDDGVALFG